MSVTGTNISLTLRNVKGSELTYSELDANQSNLKTGIENHSHDEFAPNLGADDNYVTDAEKVKLANLSGVNSGDQDLSGYSLTSHNHNLNDLTEKSYNSLTDKPTIPSVSGLLDETAHDVLDHTGLTGIPTAYTLPTASTTVLGGVKIDGTTILISDGVISSTGGSGGGVTDHGLLTGLSDDDHSQYLNETRHDALDHTGLTGVPTQYTDEMAQDAIGTLITNGTQTGITVAYDDVNNKIDFTVTAAGSGDVTGPASAVSNNIALFDGITGKIIKDSGVATSNFAPALGVDDNYVTGTEKIKLANLSGVNTGDQDLSGYSLISHLHAGIYEPADATILKDGDIGVTVQAYDADLTSWAAIAPSAKQDTLISGTNIKTINGSSVLGSGDLTITSSVTDGDKGDIVVSGLGSVFSINSNVVTPAKMSRTGTAGQVLVSGGAGADPYYLNQSSLTLASESAPGIIELATAAEALAGTDTERAVTSAGLASAKLLSTDGYQKLPGGLIIQWGRSQYTINTWTTTTFPITFPTACQSISMILEYIGTTAGVFQLNQSSLPTTSSFQHWLGPAQSGLYFRWFAIGY